MPAKFYDSGATCKILVVVDKGLLLQLTCSTSHLLSYVEEAAAAWRYFTTLIMLVKGLIFVAFVGLLKAQNYPPGVPPRPADEGNVNRF